MSSATVIPDTELANLDVKNFNVKEGIATKWHLNPDIQTPKAKAVNYVAEVLDGDGFNPAKPLIIYRDVHIMATVIEQSTVKELEEGMKQIEADELSSIIVERGSTFRFNI